MTHDEIAELAFGTIFACREEGIDDALRLAHAIAYAIKLAEEELKTAEVEVTARQVQMARIEVAALRSAGLTADPMVVRARQHQGRPVTRDEISEGVARISSLPARWTQALPAVAGLLLGSGVTLMVTGYVAVGLADFLAGVGALGGFTYALHPEPCRRRYERRRVAFIRQQRANEAAQ